MSGRPPVVQMPLFQTSLTRLLNIDLPIVQAPIGSATCPALTAAVSNAGGLGMLAVTWRSLDEVRQVIRETHRLTARPLRYIEPVHTAGALVMHTVASAAEARQAVDAGVDIIVAQGWEAGGHVLGKVATLPLVPSVVDAVAPIPVLAAGGIADGRGIAAALALGAGGVWIGTRFLVSEEAAVHPSYKEMLLHAAETDAVYSGVFDVGWADAPHRVLRNSTLSQWEAAGCPPSGQRPGEGEVIVVFADGRPVVRYSDVIPLPGMTGEVEALAVYAGQSTGLVSCIQPARDIVMELAQQAVQTLRRVCPPDTD